jgi:hypothetical protein
LCVLLTNDGVGHKIFFIAFGDKKYSEIRRNFFLAKQNGYQSSVASWPGRMFLGWMASRAKPEVEIIEWS